MLYPMRDELEDEATEVAVTVRVPKGTLDRIDALVRGRPTRVPRHSWLLEAIYEKLYKEERVEGDLDVRWENSEDVDEAARYRLRFLRPGNKERFVAPMTAVGNDCLERYLVEWGITPENAKGWIQKLRADKSVSIPDVMMPADRVGRYGFKVPGWGIQINLRDGRTAVLIPDHPAPLLDGTRGDRLTILAPTGHRKTAMVKADGTVFILTQQHIWPPGAPNKVFVEFREASEEETQEFMDVYGQCALED